MVVLGMGSGTMAETSRLEEGSMVTTAVPSPVRYSVLLPPSYYVTERRYPLLLWLHGGGGDNRFLGTQQSLFEAVWTSGLAPEMVVVTPDADRSLYLDYRDGSARWESFLLDEFLPAIAAAHRVDSGDRYIGGISMGGMGSLRMAFKHPDRFRAVVALEPGIEPALAWSEVKAEDRFWRDERLLVERFGTKDGGIDAEYWARNNPATIADRDPDRLLRSGLAIYIEVGSEDAFGLDRGTEFLHATLFRHRIRHEYRYVLGADHVGRTVPARIRDALGFLGRISQPVEPDPQVERTRRMLDAMKRRAGLPDER